MSTNVDFIAAIERESHRFGACLESADPNASVPTCPEWTAADLLWHLGEVQLFWANIVRGRLTAPDTAKVDASIRPTAFAGLLEFYARASVELIDSLAACDPSTPMWTWCDNDQTAGFVARRQAHEALIHRLDAELVIGQPTPIDPLLATDGVDEALTIMFGEAPLWAAITPSGATGLVTATDVGRTWGIEIVQLVGTSPHTGTSFDEGALGLIDPPISPSFTLTADSSTLDAWLWSRPTATELFLDGSADSIEQFMTIIGGGLQ